MTDNRCGIDLGMFAPLRWGEHCTDAATSVVHYRRTVSGSSLCAYHASAVIESEAAYARYLATGEYDLG